MARPKAVARNVEDPEQSVTNDSDRPALVPDNRESQLTNLAMNLVEERLRNGTATSQEVVTCMKLRSREAELELELLRAQKELAEAKVESLRIEKETRNAYREALAAIRSYRGEESYESVGDIEDEVF